MTAVRYVLDERGEPQPEPNMMKWCAWINTAVAADRVRVAFSRTNGAIISTVFLGLRRPEGLFMTIVVGGALNGTGAYYETRADAQAGHLKAVERAEAAPPTEVKEAWRAFEWVVMFHHNLLDVLGVT